MNCLAIVWGVPLALAVVRNGDPTAAVRHAGEQEVIPSLTDERVDHQHVVERVAVARHHRPQDAGAVQLLGVAGRVAEGHEGDGAHPASGS